MNSNLVINSNLETPTTYEVPDGYEYPKDFGHIAFHGIQNCRDMGGFQTKSGRKTKYRRLLRSDKLSAATQNDRDILMSDYDLKVVIDMRTQQERQSSPDPEKKFPGVRFVNLPVLAKSALGITHEKGLSALIHGFKTIRKDPVGLMVDLYPSLLLSDQGKEAYREFFDILIDNKQGSVLFHCSEGKDRTGIGALLVFTALGVPREVIMADYLATNRFAKGRLKTFLGYLESQNIALKEDNLLDSIVTADARYLESACTAVDKEYGSIDCYLEEALGLSSQRRQLLVDNYLE